MQNCKIDDQLIYEISGKPHIDLAIQFVQPMIYKDRNELLHTILSQGTSLEDFCTSLLGVVIKEMGYDEKQKCTLIKRMADIEEAMALGADIRTQIAGLVSAFSE